MSRPWSTLGLDGPSSLPEIRHAYAERLKTTHPEEDPEGFQELHSAYKLACKLAKKGGGSASNAQTWQTAWEYTPPQVDAPAPQEEEQQEWDYDTLLEDGKKPPHEEEQQEEEQREWDYDALLEDGKKPSREEKQEEEQREWDYDTLLEDGRRSPDEKEQEKEEQPDWDYNALFHQARTDEEKSYLRRRNALREKHCERYRRWPGKDRGQTESEEEAWLRVLAALRQMEWLCVTGAPTEIWEQFIASDLFSAVMCDPDLVFGLEELLAEHPEISRRVRKTLRTAYSAIDGGVFYGREYTPLRDLLGEKPKKQRKNLSPRVRYSLVAAWGILILLLVFRTTFWIGNQDTGKKESTSVTFGYEVNGDFKRVEDGIYYDEETDALYFITAEAGVDEKEAVKELRKKADEHRDYDGFKGFEFAYPESESGLVELTALNGSVYRHAILSLYFSENVIKSVSHFGIALSEEGTLVTVEAKHADKKDAETVKENIVHILESVRFIDPDIVTEESYRSLFRLAEDHGYEKVGYGYIKAPYEMLDKDTFVDVYLPYSEDVEHPEDGYAIRSAAHGIEVYHTIVHSEENARAVVEQAFEELTSSGVALYEDEKGIFETQYREERNFACKRVVYTEYTEDGGANARLTVFRADIKHGEYYLYTKITYYPEYMDEGHHALVEELGDALTLSLPQL